MLAFNGSVGTYQIVGLIVAILLPIAVAFVTKRVASAGVKAVTLAALASLNGLLVEFLQSQDAGSSFQLDQAILNALTGFIVAVAMHFGLWSPAKISGSRGIVATKIPGGIGTERSNT